MIPYIITLLLVYSLALLYENSRSSSIARISIVAASVLILTVLGGLRNDSVGADTVAYTNRFSYLVASHEIWDADGTADPGYKILLALSLLISTDPTILLILTSFVVALLNITALYRWTKTPSILVFSFIALGFSTFHMNGLRQGLALAVFMHAIPFLVSGRFISYTLLTIVASSFHASAIFALPMYPFFRMGFSRSFFLILVVSSVVIVYGGDVIFKAGSFANARYLTYGLRTETGGETLAIFYTGLSVIFSFGRRLVSRKQKDTYDILLSMNLLGSMIFLSVFFAGIYVEVTRIALYFLVSTPMLLSVLIKSLPDVANRTFAVLLLLLFGIVFYSLYLNTIGSFVPYEFRNFPF